MSPLIFHVLGEHLMAGSGISLVNMLTKIQLEGGYRAEHSAEPHLSKWKYLPATGSRHPPKPG